MPVCNSLIAEAIVILCDYIDVIQSQDKEWIRSTQCEENGNGIWQTAAAAQ